MSDRRQIRISKINVILLVVAWVYAIAMLNLSEDSNAEFTPIEVAPLEEEEIAEIESEPIEEEVALLPDEEVASQTEELTLPEEEIAPAKEETAESNEVITPPSVDIKAASSADASPSTQEKGQVGRIAVNATYQSDPKKVFPWLMDRGVRILLFDQKFRMLSEVSKNGLIKQVAGGSFNSGVKRTANAEVMAFVQTSLPYNAKYAVVWWPNELWAKILNPLKAYGAHSAEISYRLETNVLAVTIHRVINKQETITPAEIVHIR